MKEGAEAEKVNPEEAAEFDPYPLSKTIMAHLVDPKVPEHIKKNFITAFSKIKLLSK